uniref:Selenoprotein F n=1 Tax=Globisporangium ultimum (strain ATCC 200006 / CBS 805.95 / DAOM BR144) TaxID=431595 RepID=K3WQR6_GLOUD
MRVAKSLAFAALAATVVTTRAHAAESPVDVDTCRDLGFDAETLDCRRCDELSTFLSTSASTSDGDDSAAASKARDALQADCAKCCQDLSAKGLHAIGGTAGDKYARVVLEVCTCKFGRYPKIANFVHQHAQKHAQLEIKACNYMYYINARHPFLIFYDVEGTKQEEVGIASWDEDTISEFIEAKVAPPEEAATPAPTTTEDEEKKVASDDAEQSEEEVADATDNDEL